jgi:hypothetical protein
MLQLLARGWCEPALAEEPAKLSAMTKSHRASELARINNRLADRGDGPSGKEAMNSCLLHELMIIAGRRFSKA